LVCRSKEIWAGRTRPPTRGTNALRVTFTHNFQNKTTFVPKKRLAALML